MVAYFSVLEPGDRILGMNLAHGGHLTHGMKLNFSGRLYEVHAYGVRQDTERIDYDAMEAQAREVRPKVIVGGASAYPRLWDFERMAAIAHDVGALLFVDMAHVAGLVAADVHPSPFPHADLVTTTTHKTLRGPRGGLIFSRDELPEGVDEADFPVLNGKRALGAAVDKTVFPGVQGGPLMQVIAGKAVAFKMAAEEPFRSDQRRTVANAAVLAETVASQGARVVSGGTDNHLMLVDVTPLGVTGKEAEHLLDEIGITVNKNGIPFDPLPPNTASASASGTPATTSRGFGEDEMRAVGRIIIEAIRGRDDEAVQRRLAGEVREIVGSVPRSGAVRGVTFIRDVGANVGPILVVFVAAALLALVLTPLVRRIVVRHDVMDLPDARRVNTRSRPARRRSRGRGGVPHRRGRLRRPQREPALGPAIRDPGGHRPHRPASSAGRPRPRSVPSTTSSTCARAGSSLARSGWRSARSRSGSGSRSSTTRSATASSGSTPCRVGFTVFWIVGMINWINWIDGLDGLSSGIALIAAVTLGLISLTTQVGGGQPLVAVLCFALAGSLLGFLRWNFHPATIFAGTSGVQFVGFTLAVLAILGSAKVAVAVLVLGVPIIDTFWIIVRRLSQGRSPFTPDRSHIHHRLLDLGLSHRQTVLVIYGICIALAVISMLFSEITQAYAFLGIFVVSGLVLFAPTRGAFGRPEELDAGSYENGSNDAGEIYGVEPQARQEP